MIRYSFLLFGLSLLVSSLLMLTPVRSQVQGLFKFSQREVLSTLEFSRNEHSYRVVKLKASKGLFLEIYKKLEDGDLLLDSVNLTDKQDAFFKFAGKSANLFMQDLDGDGQPEIIAPTLDKHLKARLNVFLWDEQSERLERLTTH